MAHFVASCQICLLFAPCAFLRNCFQPHRRPPGAPRSHSDVPQLAASWRELNHPPLEKLPTSQGPTIGQDPSPDLDPVFRRFELMGCSCLRAGLPSVL